MLKHVRPALVLLALFTLLTGLVYPLAMTGIGQAAFSNQVNGSPLMRGGVVVGSSLLAHGAMLDAARLV